jgi:hypothetical protein
MSLVKKNKKRHLQSTIKHWIQNKKVKLSDEKTSESHRLDLKLQIYFGSDLSNLILDYLFTNSLLFHETCTRFSKNYAMEVQRSMKRYRLFFHPRYLDPKKCLRHTESDDDDSLSDGSDNNDKRQMKNKDKPQLLVTIPVQVPFLYIESPGDVLNHILSAFPNDLQDFNSLLANSLHVELSDINKTDLDLFDQCDLSMWQCRKLKIQNWNPIVFESWINLFTFCSNMPMLTSLHLLNSIEEGAPTNVTNSHTSHLPVVPLPKTPTFFRLHTLHLDTFGMIPILLYLFRFPCLQKIIIKIPHDYCIEYEIDYLKQNMSCISFSPFETLFSSHVLVICPILSQKYTTTKETIVRLFSRFLSNPTFLFEEVRDSNLVFSFS